MNKLRNMLIASIAIVCLSTVSWAGSMNIGVVTSMLDIDANGTETDTLTAGGANVADASTRTKSVSEQVFTGSIFAEYTLDTRWALTGGVEITPGKADIGGKFARTDAVLSFSGVERASQTGEPLTRAVQATASGFGTMYVEAPLFGAFYVRAGASRMTIDHGSDSYQGDIDLTGTNLGFGLKGNRNGFIYKLAYEQTDYGSFNIRTPGNDVAGETSAIAGNVDTAGVRLSVGKTF